MRQNRFFSQTSGTSARNQNFLSASRDFGGWYSSLNYQFNRNWGAGLRYDETSLPFNPSLHRSRGTALLEYSPSEWNKLRLQFNQNNSNFGLSFPEVLFQWNIVLGPHGAHKY